MTGFESHAVMDGNGDVYCMGGKCLPPVILGKVVPIYANTTWDHVPICKACGKEHQYMTVLDPRALAEIAPKGSGA